MNKDLLRGLAVNVEKAFRRFPAQTADERTVYQILQPLIVKAKNGEIETPLNNSPLRYYSIEGRLPKNAEVSKACTDFVGELTLLEKDRESYNKTIDFIRQLGQSHMDED